MSRIVHFQTAALKAAVVLGPSYLAAYLTDKMVWVVPTLAASSFFAATIGLKDEDIANRTDEDGDADDGDDSDQGDIGESMSPLDGG